MGTLWLSLEMNVIRRLFGRANSHVGIVSNKIQKMLWEIVFGRKDLCRKNLNLNARFFRKNFMVKKVFLMNMKRLSSTQKNVQYWTAETFFSQ